MIAAVILMLFPLIGMTDMKQIPSTNGPGPDTIILDIAEKTGSDEMPPVQFQHGRHNDAAEGKCVRCHTRDNNTLVFSFKRNGQTPSMDLYHSQCIGCHVEEKTAGRPTGPMAAECRSCHGNKPPADGPGWEKMVFGKSLHFIHETSKDIVSLDPAAGANCSACHHKYNAKTKETYYVKGQEEACTYCHKAERTDDIRAMRTAAHDSCVGCHESLKQSQIKSGPVTCQGCHSKEEQAKIKPAENITRLKRNQPDEVLMAGMVSSTQPPEYLMAPVAFDHKRHEAAAVSCKTCHHDTLKKCSDCHTPKGDTNGDHIRLEQAMHSIKASQSCVGCHHLQTAKKDCAGCHAQMPLNSPSKESCKTCHSVSARQVIKEEARQKSIARKTLDMIQNRYTALPIDKIPETVVIDDLADEYKASEFPHRKVVLAIAERAEKSELANVFHKSQETLCMGCHHNSPQSLTPPKCASCHGKTTDLASGKPHLKGAFHGQCISCHQKMAVETVAATDCIKCHEKK